MASKEIPNGNKLAESTKLDETTDKELNKMKEQLPSRIDVPYEEWTDEQKELDRKIACIEMIHSILTYDDIKSADDVMQNKYMQRYIEELGETKVKELVEQEIEEFKSATINKDVYTDSEGVTYNSVTFKDESKTLTEAPTKDSAEYKKLCTEIEFQADENDFNLTEEDVKAVADKMIANKFFFNYNIMDDEDNENVQDWETINSIIVSTIKDYLDETKTVKEAKEANSLSDSKFEDFKLEDDGYLEDGFFVISMTIKDDNNDIADRMKSADKENYCNNCYGADIILKDPANSIAYYVCNDGNREEFDYVFTDEEVSDIMKLIPSELKEAKSEECDLEDCKKCIKELQDDIQNHKLGYHNKQYTKAQVRENKKINSAKIKELEAKMANLKK